MFYKCIRNILYLYRKNSSTIICIRIWYLVPNICSRVSLYVYAEIVWINSGIRDSSLSTAYSTTLIQFENGEISRYGVSRNVLATFFFFFSLPFFHASEFNIRMKFYRDTLVNRFLVI